MLRLSFLLPNPATSRIPMKLINTVLLTGISGRKGDGSGGYNEIRWSILENTEGAYEKSKII